ncbi:MAG: YdcF family protein, partial [Rhizobacter sp.]
MNSLFILLGIESWKPVLVALLLPPVPFLIAILVGARLVLPRRGWGWGVIVLSVLGLWLTSTYAMGR